MNVNPSYRKLLLTDLPEARRVFQDILVTSEKRAILGTSSNSDWLEEELSQGEGRGLFNGNRLVAFIVYRSLPGAISDIVFLGTDPEFQNEGLMVHLMTQWLEECKTCKEVWLEVHEANLKAQRLYQKFGFTVVGRRVNYYSDGCAALLFTLKI